LKVEKKEICVQNLPLVDVSLVLFRLRDVFRLETSFAANPKDLLTLLYVCGNVHSFSRNLLGSPYPLFLRLEPWFLTDVS
jgi:hypothetical protein